jgi:hypothetical protein
LGSDHDNLQLLKSIQVLYFSSTPEPHPSINHYSFNKKASRSLVSSAFNFKKSYKPQSLRENIIITIKQEFRTVTDINTGNNPIKILVLEGICGVGKSTRMIHYIKENPDERYLIVLPLLDELDRYQEELPGLNFKEPSNGKGTKKEHFKNLLRDKCNILCTHALFSLWDTEIESLIKEAGYHIIIDEETSVIESGNSGIKTSQNHRLKTSHPL